MIALAWQAALPVVAGAAKGGRWKTVQGAMTAAIATALDMEWAPATPSKWLSQQRDASADVEADDAGWQQTKGPSRRRCGNSFGQPRRAAPTDQGSKAAASCAQPG